MSRTNLSTGADAVFVIIPAIAPLPFQGRHIYVQIGFQKYTSREKSDLKKIVTYPPPNPRFPYVLNAFITTRLTSPYPSRRTSCEAQLPFFSLLLSSFS